MTLLRLVHRLRSDSRGATLVEFAIAGPVLIMLMLGALQIGMGMHANGGLRELMGWAGRVAVVAYQEQADGVITAEQLKQRIADRVAEGGLGLQPDRLTTTVTITDDETLNVKRVVVDLAYALAFDVPFVTARTVTLHENRTFFVPL